MWLIEKITDSENYFLPINLEHVTDISKSKGNGNYYISFHYNFVEGAQRNQFYERWEFEKKEIRNDYFEKILESLPRLDLGFNKVTL